MPKEDKQPWLSIVTVVKDDPTGFDCTRESILSQTLSNYEWIVIDSSSVKLKQTGVTAYKWVEPQGIFQAMNVGLTLCEGRYVLFLNAGDCLEGPSTLERIRFLSEGVQLETVLFGDVTFVEQDGTPLTPPPLEFELEREHFFTRGRFPPHQGLLTPPKLLRQAGGFDESFTIASDYKTLLKLSKDAKFLYIPIVISNFALGGISSQRRVASAREFHRARMEVYSREEFSELTAHLSFLRELAAVTAVKLRSVVSSTSSALRQK